LISDASMLSFPEQPQQVADAVLSWRTCYRDDGLSDSLSTRPFLFEKLAELTATLTPKKRALMQYCAVFAPKQKLETGD